jgi:hypothetical protein
MNPLEGSFPFTRSLPPLGTREGVTLDFKATIKLTDKGALDDPFEAAKDVAAFANTYGGTLLIGAAHVGEAVSKYLPMTDAVASTIERLVEESVRDRCRPAPSVAFERFAYDAGVVLAVHVAPFPSVVAVRVKGDKDDGYGDAAWVFFSRVTSQCKEFTPEVLPMLMLPEVRRVAILLRSIPPGIKVDVQLNHSTTMSDSTLVSVDELANVAFFENHTLPTPFEVALDAIASVFRRHDGKWFVRCS